MVGLGRCGLPAVPAERYTCLSVNNLELDRPVTSPLRIAFVSLGCAKNVVDSEKMLGQLAEAGCELTADETDADVMVINTCGFLDASRVEADAVIRDAVKLKRTGNLKRVVVAGCLVQRDKETILGRVKGIDALVGVNNRDDVVRAVLGVGELTGGDGNVRGTGTDKQRYDRSLKVVGGGSGSRSGKLGPSRRKPDIYLADYHPFVQIDTARLRITPKHYAYLRISEGCDQKCTFCTIPSIRGRMHCKPPPMILAEARELVADGAVELSLIGQDTTSYGLGDDAIEGGLASLLRQLNAVDGLAWVRLMYVYPSVMSDDIIDAMAECDRVCKYIDIPLQHINDRVLKAMHRRITREETEALLDRLKARIPGVTIRTTLIAGFPGETDAEFEELVQFVRDFRFAALGVFPYSLEPDTPAGRMKNQIPDRVKKERVEALMLAQQEVAFAMAEETIGKRFEVLIDERIEEGVVRGRHQGQAPGVDSVCVVEGCEAGPGDFVEARCVARSDYDLITTPTRVSLPLLHA
jgi:ribosomal protein S12 methylthiotransferase